jgi:hypothetical protein
MDRECHTIYCRQLATFEMKADGEIFQLQNGSVMQCPPLQRLATGHKHLNSVGFDAAGVAL